MNSKFGWLLSGPTESVINQETTVTNLIITGNSNGLFNYTQDPLIDTLKQFWETESIGIKDVSEIMKSPDGFNEQVRFKPGFHIVVSVVSVVSVVRKKFIGQI